MNKTHLLLKTITSLLFTIISISCYSQSFNGVNISGDVSVTIKEFKSKGFKVMKQVDNIYQLSGMLGLKQVDLYVYSTPISKRTARFVVLFEEKSSFSLLKEQFQEFHNIFLEKYGEPTKKIRETGIAGYENYESALKNGKIVYADYWFSVGTISISLSISKFLQLEISYENDKNMQLMGAEIKKQNLNIY